MLRLEGLFFLLTSLSFYHQYRGNWIIFVVLILVPDLSMVGYLKNKKVGAIVYNLGHNYVLSLLTVFAGVYFSFESLIYFGLILTAHVAMDRFFGFGLKYPTDFKDTHIQKV